MIAQDLRSGVERLGEMIAEASIIVPFTGAGISTECGIPDFRSPGGIWTRNRPINFDEFVVSQEARDEAWRRRFAMSLTPVLLLTPLLTSAFEGLFGRIVSAL